MAKTIIVAGYGPGVSTAVAERFGKEGFAVALVARNAARLAEGQKALSSSGIRAEVFPADLSQPETAHAVVAKVREKLGPISVLHWNAYSGAAGDLLRADIGAIRGVMDVAVTSLVMAVQEALPDLRAQKGGVLVTNGGFAYYDPKIDEAGVKFNSMGLSAANAAKHKMVGMLAHRLKDEGVYIGEVVIRGTVKGSAWDTGNADVDPAAVAAKFWELWSARKETSVNV